MGKVSIAKRLQVVCLSQQGLSQAKISRQTGVSRSAIQALLQKHKKNGTVEDQKRSGRPRKLSGADERHIQRMCLQNERISSCDITSELAVSCGTLVDPSTVRRSLARNGLNRRRSERSQEVRCGENKDEKMIKRLTDCEGGQADGTTDPDEVTAEDIKKENTMQRVAEC